MSLFNKLHKKDTDGESEKEESVKIVEKEIKEIKPEETKKEALVKEEKKEPKEFSGKAKDKKKKDWRASKILIRPLVTEKITDLGAQGKYGFEVAKKSNKIEIAKAIESAYGVKPVKVSVSNVSGKRVRYGKTSGKTKDWKKAIITLKAGDKIEVFEGV